MTFLTVITRAWIVKWSLYLSGLYDAYRVLIESMVVSIVEQKQSFRSIISVISAQVYYTGVQALPFVLFLSSIISFVVMFQAKFQMTFWGSTDLPGFLFVSIIFRELSVIVPALLLVARSGSAVASEIASMKVNREVDSLKIMGIHPYSYIVFPRVIGGFVSLLGLAIYFNFVAIFVSAISSNILFEMDFLYFISLVFDQLVFQDILIFFIKITISSLLIFSVCCSKGLAVKKSTHEIPQATMSAVVSSLVYVIVFNFMFTAIFYFIKYQEYL